MLSGTSEGFFAGRARNTREGWSDPGKREGGKREREGGFSAGHRQNRLYIFEQLVSRSFSTARLTLTRSVTPGPGTLQSQLSAIRMRVITRHSWLLRSTSVLAKFPRSNASLPPGETSVAGTRTARARLSPPSPSAPPDYFRPPSRLIALK